ncbi:MAG: dienelactone hydrolase family protein [Betaproteobacteria bacterium]|jgi:carboxymethylenebutenolidase|nr:dienelactone hydrolase family protein [Betaproteobacteria bacterium]NBP45624.1 dienelactone hydrolase family protein [Betaproteobacteria bacterium]
MNNWINDTQALLDVPAQAPHHALNRRGLLKSSLGVGYALAAMPIMAQTAIKTDAQGLDVGEVVIKVGNDQVPVYRARPAQSTNAPVVLVISEIFGVHDYIADVARRLAKAGYYAMAPDLFMRQGDPSSYGEIAKLNAEVISKVPDAQVMGDLDACVEFAATEGADTQRLAITGFCWGGRITWLYAAHQPKLKTAVAWYGRLVGQTNAFQTAHPLSLAAQVKVPVLGLYGGEDTGIPVSTVDQMKQALAKAPGAASRSEFVIYPQAPHAFHADYRGTYRADAAQDGWQRMLAWFKKYGV